VAFLTKRYSVSVVLCVARYRRQCCRRAGVVSTVQSAKAVASLTMKAAWFCVTSATLASTSIALTRHLTRCRRVRGSASGALCAWRAVQRRRASSTAARGRTTTHSVQSALA